MRLRFNESDGSAVTWAVMIIALLLTSTTLVFAFGSVATAQNRAAISADLIAVSGCDFAKNLSMHNGAEVVRCSDDGVRIAVETRTRINLPLRVTTLFAHARAQSVHLP